MSTKSSVGNVSAREAGMMEALEKGINEASGVGQITDKERKRLKTGGRLGNLGKWAHKGKSKTGGKLGDVKVRP